LERRPLEFDLLITDQTMPSMTGKQLAAKALMLRPTLPIILCSGYNSLMGEEEIQKSGISAFLQKPVTRNILLHQCAKTLTES
jgi:FixJ family two-component response regulator